MTLKKDLLLVIDIHFQISLKLIRRMKTYFSCFYLMLRFLTFSFKKTEAKLGSLATESTYKKKDLFQLYLVLKIESSSCSPSALVFHKVVIFPFLVLFWGATTCKQ